MKTLYFAIFALAVLTLVGCKGFHPVGPLAKKLPITQQGKQMSAPSDAAASSRSPSIKAPTTLVQPEDITTENASEMAAKIATELNTDAKAAVNGPITVEVSHIKGGVKQK